MLATLRNVFRPTWTKIIFSVIVGPALTVGALVLAAGARHGPDIIQYGALPFAMPYALMGWLKVGSRFFWIALLATAFLYWYVISCVFSYLLAHFRRRSGIFAKAY